MAKITIGVQVRPQHTTWDAYQRAWLQADELGVDTLYNWDHFFPLFGDANGPHFEAWTQLAALGPQTKRARVGCLVHSMSYRNPALLSNMAKTLDHATNGRVILGIGAGWAKRDYDEFGYEFGTAGDRLRNLERGLEVIKDRWQKDPPRPVNGTIPILIGGGGEKVTLRITAQHADMWNGFGPPGIWRAKNAVLDNWCGKVGRDPAEIERTVHLGLAEAPQLADFLAAGATHYIFSVPAPYDLGPLDQLLAWRDQVNAAPR